jgi:hypothetical protein
LSQNTCTKVQAFKRRIVRKYQTKKKNGSKKCVRSTALVSQTTVSVFETLAFKKGWKSEQRIAKKQLGRIK